MQLDTTTGFSPSRSSDVRERDNGRHYLLVFEDERAWMNPLPAQGEVIIGRDESANVLISDASVSREHVRLVIGLGEAKIVDLGSTNGTRVNGERLVGTRPLVSGDTILAGNVTLVFHSSMRTSQPHHLVALTQFQRRCEEEVERALRYHRPLALVCFDFGSDLLDQPLTSAALEGKLRLLDLLAWSSGNQLLALLPETDSEHAPAAAERMIGLLEKVATSVRAGVASCPNDGCDVTTLLTSARCAASACGEKRVGVASDACREIVIGEATAIVADPVMARLYGLVERLAMSDLPVLVGGETGAGKELVANALHHFSPRRQGKLVTVNCAALTETLLEGELFGWERGAFSGAVAARAGHLESASGGTVFLDEVGELSMAAQAKLLRAIESKKIMRLGDSRERPIDIRLVAATNRDLQTEVKRGTFRQDLFFRLSGARLWIPPLRDRPREMPLLAQRFLFDASKRLGRMPLTLASETLQIMSAYTWPGNIRELRHLSDYLAITVAEDVVFAQHLPEGMIPNIASGSNVGQFSSGSNACEEPQFRPLAEELGELSKARILAALQHTKGNQTRAAQLLGMPRRTFLTKLREFGLHGSGSAES